ncbi:MAG TPA: branched-chain amino acid ABC transporter permease [Methylomirabilota bacterium]|nr:branched-chain amino acid ABC transporter permease [Methylomirabilota bacterium]
MIILDVILSGIVVGGMYALIAMGLNLQYGVARIMNLSYGEFLMTAAFSTFWFFTLWKINPLLSLLFSIPVAFIANWLIYRVLLRPLVRRAHSAEQLEGDTILATFGLLFLIEGAALLNWGGHFRGYSFLATPVNILDITFALNRLLAFAVACLLGLAAYWFLRSTRAGTAIRAVAVDAVAAQLVAVDVPRYSAFAFATGGAMVAASGTLISMFIAFNPSIGISYTLKALIVIILGGVGHMMGSLVAGLILGVAESLGAYLVDPGLTLAINYAIFVLILLVRPKGLFASK